jgi:hypothetical protein
MMNQAYINDNGNLMIFYVGVGWKEFAGELVRNVKDEVRGGQKVKPIGLFQKLTGSTSRTHFQIGESWTNGNDFYYVDGKYDLRVIKGATQAFVSTNRMVH